MKGFIVIKSTKMLTRHTVFLVKLAIHNLYGIPMELISPSMIRELLTIRRETRGRRLILRYLLRKPSAGTVKDAIRGVLGRKDTCIMTTEVLDPSITGDCLDLLIKTEQDG